MPINEHNGLNGDSLHNKLFNLFNSLYAIGDGEGEGN